MKKHKCKVFKDETTWIVECQKTDRHFNPYITFTKSWDVAVRVALRHYKNGE